MARVKGRKPPVYVNARPDDKHARPSGKGHLTRGFVLGCGAPLKATSTTGDPFEALRETCGSEVDGAILLCPACIQTHESFQLPIRVRVAGKAVK